VTVNNANSVGEAETIEDWAEGHNFCGKNKNESIFFQRKGIIHRLDKDTSGILLLAKNEAVFDAMQVKFKNREISKKYLALVHGVLDKEGSINEGIARNKAKGKFVVDATGKPSLTDYILINKYIFNSAALNDFEKNNYERLRKKYDVDNFSLLTIQIHTGRTHQIRVHFSYIKHPVVGDTLYGFHKLIKFEKLWCPRQFLHAVMIEFAHPISGKKILLKSALPKDLGKILDIYMVKGGN
jgi:23S rRNA pseudouridine1911/1915/1917 synthase